MQRFPSTHVLGYDCVALRAATRQLLMMMVGGGNGESPLNSNRTARNSKLFLGD
jgi:hypothetical protein